MSFQLDVKEADDSHAVDPYNSELFDYWVDLIWEMKREDEPAPPPKLMIKESLTVIDLRQVDSGPWDAIPGYAAEPIEPNLVVWRV